MRAGRRALFIVWRKELLENLRDRRTLFSALLLGPLFGPLLLAASLQLMMQRGTVEAGQPIELAVVHGERAPELLRFLADRQVRIAHIGLDEPAVRNAVRERTHPLVLWIPEDFTARFAAAQPAPLLLYTDQSDSFDDSGLERLRALLAQHGATLGSLRLVARGVDPLVIRPLALHSIDVSTPRSRAALALGMLSYIVVFAMLMGGLYLAIDATAGERERGSLEPLLATPVAREQIIYGKILATCTYMLVSLALTVSGCALAIELVGLESYGMSASLGPGAALLVILVAAPLIPAGAGLMTVVASFTRSYREAQTWLGFVLLVPTLPLAFASLLGVKPSLALMAVPSLSQHFLITGLLRDEPLGLAELALSAGVSLALGLALALLAGRLYRRDSVLG